MNIISLLQMASILAQLLPEAPWTCALAPSITTMLGTPSR
jgi:hypothetical protein